MSVKLKKLNDQVIVITGASSGIGLATAEMAVERGARVVLAARSEEELHDVAARLNRSGKRATAIGADVSDEGAVQRIADHAVGELAQFFGQREPQHDRNRPDLADRQRRHLLIRGYELDQGFEIKPPGGVRDELAGERIDARVAG